MQQCSDCLKIYDESEYVSCPYCNENDEVNYEESFNGVCPECEGSGRVECDVCEGEGGDEFEVCSACNGDGGMVCPDW